MAIAALAVVGCSGAAGPVDPRALAASHLSPNGSVGGAIEFQWAPPEQPASHYRLQLRGASGDVLFTMESSAARVPLPPALRDRLVPGQRYTWYVETLDAFGDVVASSGSATIVVEP